MSYNAVLAFSFIAMIFDSTNLSSLEYIFTESFNFII